MTETREFDAARLPECAFEADVPDMAAEFAHETGTIRCRRPAVTLIDYEDLIYSDRIDRLAFCREHADAVLAEAQRSVGFSAREVAR